MFTNYIKVALRNLGRHRGYSVINIAGLAVGIAVSLLILLYVRDELGYDRHHERADRVYRVALGSVSEGAQIEVTPSIVAPLFKRDFPEVVEATRLYDIGNYRSVVVRAGDELYEEDRFMYADSTVFDVFTLPMTAGTPAGALNRPNTIVLTASTARKYFGDENPVGRTLEIDGSRTFEVTGVVEDVPASSHFQFDLMGSFVSTSWADREIWDSANFYTYLLLQDGAAIAPLREKVEARLAEAREQEIVSDDYALFFQPLTELHLYVNGGIRYVYLFSAIALLIVLIACINYMNLATARSARRAREVGLRKTAGAYRGQLIAQFYGESGVVTFMALALALGAAALALPVFNQLSGKAFEATALLHPSVLLLVLGIGGVVTLVAGSYPALLLSSFQPVEVLKGTFRSKGGSGLFRQGLVVFQFAVSVVLLVGTAVVYSQLRYVQTRDLGFEDDQVVVLSIGDAQLRENHEALKADILQLPGVRAVSAMNSIPGYQRGGYALNAEGLELGPNEVFIMRGVPADRDVVEALGLDLLAGPGFPRSEGYTTEQGYVYVINEATARQLGWTPEEAVGKWFNLLGNRRGEVVGVVRDFHYASLHEAIEPLAFFMEAGSYQHLLVKADPGGMAGTIDALRRIWAERAPHRPFEFDFLDRRFAALYRADEQLGLIFGLFAGMAILIGSLGLFGLASFMAEQRTKEIGVRKVLGASVRSLVMLLSREFALLVGIAFVLAAPVAYLAMNRWLDDFAFRIDLNVGLFLAAGAAVLLVALLSVGYQALRAATSDPIKALRYE